MTPTAWSHAFVQEMKRMKRLPHVFATQKRVSPMLTERPEHVLAVARAIWASEWEGPFPRDGTIEYDMSLQMARAAIAAMGNILLART